MKKLPVKILFISFALAVTAACGGRRNVSQEYDGELYTPEYAQCFALYRYGENSSVLEVRNPWQGAEGVTTSLFISREGERAPEGFQGQSVAAPLRNVVCLSSSYIAFIDALGETDAIKGVSGARYITNETIRQRHRTGSVSDLGYDTNMNYEMLAAMKPDIVFMYGVGGENTAVTNKLHELGITTTYIAEYLEESPLGKAEWIVAFGELFDKRDRAAEIFDGIARRYESLRSEAAGFDVRPSVMLNAPYRDVWFVPGDRSYMVRLITDAGGSYACAGEDSAVSRPISGEAAWVAASGADVWIGPGQAATLAEVTAQNAKFADIKSVRQGRVYNNTKRRTDGGGSDFWESGALRADRVLEDLIICLHPEWAGATDAETYYFEHLK